MSSTGTNDSLSEFAEVLAIVRPQAVQKIASDLLGGQSCTVDINPRSGSFNLIYPITFSNGTKWAARVPQHAVPKYFGEHQAETMRSELHFQRQISKETTIPIPGVVYFDVTFNNEFGAPFSIVTWLEGTRVLEAWDKYDGPGSREQRRIRMLESTADAIVQLTKWFAAQIGVPALQPTTVKESTVKVNNLCARDTSKEWVLMLEGTEGPLFCFYEHGPFYTAFEYLNSMLNRIEFRGSCKFAQGQRKILQIMIDAIRLCESHSGLDSKFVLTHPDFDAQNILVKEDGTLSGILDWDGLHTAPMQLGFAKYPLWLIRDWTPDAYHFWSQTEEHRLEEDTPAQLARYRRLYHGFIQQRLQGKVNDCANAAINSHIFQAMEAVCYSVHSFHAVVTKISRICLQGSIFQMDHDVLYDLEATSDSTSNKEYDDDSCSAVSSCTSTCLDENRLGDWPSSKQEGVVFNENFGNLGTSEDTYISAIPTTKSPSDATIGDDVEKVMLPSSRNNNIGTNAEASRWICSCNIGKLSPSNDCHSTAFTDNTPCKGSYTQLPCIYSEDEEEDDAYDTLSEWKTSLQGNSRLVLHSMIILATIWGWFLTILCIGLLSGFQVASQTYETVHHEISMPLFKELMTFTTRKCCNMLLLPFQNTKATVSYQDCEEISSSSTTSIKMTGSDTLSFCGCYQRSQDLETTQDLDEGFGVAYEYLYSLASKMRNALARGYNMLRQIIDTATNKKHYTWYIRTVGEITPTVPEFDYTAKQRGPIDGDEDRDDHEADDKHSFSSEGYHSLGDNNKDKDENYDDDDDSFSDALTEQDEEGQSETTASANGDTQPIKLSPNHSIPFWLRKLFNALGEDKLSNEHLEALTEAFAAKFSSTEVIEDYATIDD